MSGTTGREAIFDVSEFPFVSPNGRPCAHTVRQGLVPLAARQEIEHRALVPATCAPSLDNVRYLFVRNCPAVLASKFLPTVREPPPVGLRYLPLAGSGRDTLPHLK